MSWRTRLVDLIEAHSGIVLDSATVDASVTRLAYTRSSALGLPHPDAYIQRLASDDPPAGEFERLVDLVATGYTCFYRAPGQLQAAVEHAARLARANDRPARIWCACCSTGEEAYTLAMLLERHQVPGTVLATDIKSRSIEVGRRGVYTEWEARRLPMDLARSYFKRSGARLEVCDELRTRVDFEVNNLLWSPVPLPAEGGWDVICCRNAFIYLSESAIQKVSQRLADALRHDGAAFFAFAETPAAPLQPVDLSGVVAWRRGNQAAALAKPLAVSPRPVPPVQSRLASQIRTRQAGTRPTPVDPPRLVFRGDEDPVAGRPALLDLLERNPALVPAWLSLGNSHLLVHSFEEAERAYRKAESLDPLRAEVHYMLGVLARKLGDRERAIWRLQRTLFLDPDFWPATFLLAGELERRGERQEVVRLLLQALEGARAGFEHLNLQGSGWRHALPSAPEVAEVCERRLDSHSDLRHGTSRTR